MAENFDNLFYLPVSDRIESKTVPEPKEVNESRLNSINDPVDVSDEAMIVSDTIEYKAINYHWFFSSYLLDKLIWLPMSYKDSNNLENTYKENMKSIKDLRRNSFKSRSSKNTFIVPIKGGRYEVDLVDMIKTSVYWNDNKLSEVRRCLWFYKENDDIRFQPYDEDYCEFLETEYEKTIKMNTFHKRIDYVKAQSKNEDSQTHLEEAFVFHSNSIMLHFTQANLLDEFGNLNSDAKRPRIVKRGIDEIVEKVEPDEIDRIDHLCFVIHGIGEGCDLKFRPIVECVDDFRDIGAFIIDSHLKPHLEANNLNGRVEFLPISWHQDLHGDPTGVDNRLKPISLPSIPKLRQYSNSTILDVLFYTSPIYCQTIISKVGNELNRLVQIFMQRNPYFNGTISLIGHSLGSLIVFDLLSHQYDEKTENNSTNESNQQNLKTCETMNCILERLNLNEFKDLFEKEKITIDCLHLLNENDLCQIGLPVGPRKLLLDDIRKNLLKKDRDEVERKIKENLLTLKQRDLQNESSSLNQHTLTNSIHKKSADYCNYGLAGTGQLVIKYPQLNFKVANFFALGSPIGMFLTVRGIEKVETEFKLPTCDSFFNIFHPFDPVAYRIEPLINSSTILKPVLMPHHKGRKRMHIELREGFSKVSVDLKEKMYGQIKNAWNSLANFNLAKLGTSSSSSNLPVIETTSVNTTTSVTVETEPILEKTPQTEQVQINENKDELKQLNEETVKIDLGKLNKGRRIDYVLQESPIESFNEYLFALASHACYWESEDSLLLIIKEIYGQGNTTDTNTELQLSDHQAQMASWITQAAASAISNNVQKTFSYFNLSVPQSISSVLASSITSAVTSSSSKSSAN